MAKILFERNTDYLKNVPLSDTEFEQVKSQIFAVKTPLEANRLLSSGQLSLMRDVEGQKGNTVTLFFFWQHDVAGGQNCYEVVRQIQRRTQQEAGQDHRFDVTLLISGIPVIHLELKREGRPLSQAYWQIRDYVACGDFAGFYSLVQLFVILNGDESRYFARPSSKDGFNLAFCFGWANEKNEPIAESSQFIKAALRVPMGHKLMSLYMIADRPKGILKVLRSYQVFAVEQILSRLRKVKFHGGEDNILGGYIWHTTGSGKTMTSFKAAQLASHLRDVDKVVFLADRNELVKQTIQEYSGFVRDEKEIKIIADSHQLLTALLDKNQRLVVSSIQKMDHVARKGKQQALSKTNIVFIVDEAHRSTAGYMLMRIRESYPTAVWFGFTGTPIMDEKEGHIQTRDLFGNPLHIYSVADGILDKNVLGFDVRQNFPIAKGKLRSAVAEWQDPSRGAVYYDWLDKHKVSDLEIEKQLSASVYEKPEWYEQVSRHILNQWLQNSVNRKFSAMLAVTDIKSANRYFNVLKENCLGLKVAVVYDPSSEYGECSFEEKESLRTAIIHYNQTFNKSYGLDSYALYKEDVVNRLSRREEYKQINKGKTEEQLDLIIVVWQLLTGFDAPYLNTLYLDKVLYLANLIQAFSRTNRILDTDKRQGIIEYFRSPIQMALNIEEAFKLYSNKNASGAFFVPSKQENRGYANTLFEQISQLFPSTINGETDFSHLPKDEESQKQFARFCNELEKTMIALRQQGFSWDNPKETKHMDFDQEQYHQIKARYQDLAKVNIEPGLPKRCFEIDPMLAEGDGILIDQDYFTKLLKELMEAEANKRQAIKLSIEPLLNQLRENDRQLAQVIIADIESGQLKFIPDFQTLLDQYRNEKEQNQVNDFVGLFGLNRELFNKLQAHHILGKDDWRDYGLMDKLIESADMDLVKSQFLSEDPHIPTDSIMLSYLLEERIKKEVEAIILAR